MSSSPTVSQSGFLSPESARRALTGVFVMAWSASLTRASTQSKTRAYSALQKALDACSASAACRGVRTPATRRDTKASSSCARSTPSARAAASAACSAFRPIRRS